MQESLLVYIFACFSVGIACLSLLVVSARRKGAATARAFLVFYLFVSLVVIGTLLRAFIDLRAEPVSPTVRFVVEYVESFIGRYGVMFSLAYFAHRVFAVDRPARRDYVIGAIVAVAALGQHLTEFWLSKTWDDRGDLFEDLLMAAIVIYAIVLGFTRLGKPGVDRALALRLLFLLAIGMPGAAYDLFFSDDTALKFIPFYYCVGSVVVTWTLMQARPPARPGSVRSEWGLSEREAEVAGLVLRGHSNKEIADELNISTNTVKTHLRAVFEKSGLRSRFELISAGHSSSGPGP